MVQFQYFCIAAQAFQNMRLYLNKVRTSESYQTLDNKIQQLQRFSKRQHSSILGREEFARLRLLPIGRSQIASGLSP